MSLRRGEVYSEKDASMMNALQLAYLGDTVWETLIRDTLVRRRLNVHHLHSACIQYVNAGAQASFLNLLLPELTELEAEISRRGRNTHAHHPVPKNQNPEDYSAATGFEAVIGFLYLTGQEERIIHFSNIVFGGNPDG